MRTHSTLAAALVLALVACGDDPAPHKDPPPPTPPGPPTFAGIESTRYEGTNIVLRWRPATDDHTPAEELRYELLVWEDDPRRRGMGTEPDRTDVTPSAPCDPCLYRHSLPASGSVVWWFAVEVTDRDSQYAPGAGAGGEGGSAVADHSAGRDVVWPGAARVGEPGFGDPWSSSTSVQVGEALSLLGSGFLDEPTADDAVRIGEVVVPLDAVRTWSDQLIELTVPADASSGPVTVTTPWGTATSPTLEVRP